MLDDRQKADAADVAAVRAASRIARTTDALARAFDISRADRDETVRRMLSRNGKWGAGYWLQLLLATGIATFGLVLDSTAVVIGAMLISPLMGPIVDLGMGLAIGSPFLVIRSFSKTILSIAVVMTIATMLTLSLPFHEVTGEISARTSPTALDLGVAIFCALAAAYAVIRPGSDTTATAAGTAIGIALVPPLCVVGFGFGTNSPRIAGGASLLFTANLCAILLFAVFSFLLLGYSQVAYRQLENDELGRFGTTTLTGRFARRLHGLFASSYGPAFRVLMPLVLLVAVYVPLRRALAEVTWEIGVRAEIQKVLAVLPERSVQSSVRIEHREISVRLVTVGRQVDAADLEKRLAQRIEGVAGVKPTVEVLALPDDASFRRIEETLTASRPEPSAPAHADLALLRQQAEAALTEAWSDAAAGPLLRWRLELAGSGPPVVEVVHFGPPLGAAGDAFLGRSLSKALGGEVTIRDLALSGQPIVAELGGGLSWLPAAGEAVGTLRADPALVVCVETPDPVGRTPPDVEGVVGAIHASPVFKNLRVHIAKGERWAVRLSQAPCAPAADGGVAGDGAPMEDAGAIDQPR